MNNNVRSGISEIFAVYADRFILMYGIWDTHPATINVLPAEIFILMESFQLISYIAPGAPATRRPSTGRLPFLRPEIGFTPKWYHQLLDIDFGEKWHTDPDYRKQTYQKMRHELDTRFPGCKIGAHGDDEVPDLITGVYGACAIAAIYGVPPRYAADQWPVSEHVYLTDDQMVAIKPPRLENNPFFRSLMDQVDHIATGEGKAYGFINWQGVLNNAQRIRGQQLFMDMFLAPDYVKHLLDCVCTTMIEAAHILQEKQRKTGVNFSFFTVSNCLVNMLSPDLYREFLLPLDQRIAKSFGFIGIHNCAWNADPYLDDYAKVNGVKYLDMGMDSNLEKARILFQETRRAIMYTPMDAASKDFVVIKKDLEYIAGKYGPCDLVIADVEYGTPDGKILDIISLCREISAIYDGLP